MHVKRSKSQTDRAIWALAERQHGVVSRTQLLELALNRGAITHRIELGRLHPVHRGVYRIGLLTRHGRWMAAVLACGPGAVLSHLAAAALFGIRQSDRIEVTTRTTCRGPNRVIVHRSPLRNDERTTHRGIPTTTVPRTLLDLSAVVPPDALRSALRQAEQLRLTDPLSLSDLAERYPRRPGLAAIRALLEDATIGARVIRSELEERFQSFLLNAGLPLPQTNQFVEGFEVDCIWPDQRLIVELDGRAAHDTFHAFEQDRIRDRVLAAAGWRVIRVTWRQLHEEPELLEADLRALLGQPASRTT
jgi:very-short-patch-repair endonuclease